MKSIFPSTIRSGAVAPVLALMLSACGGGSSGVSPVIPDNDSQGVDDEQVVDEQVVDEQVVDEQVDEQENADSVAENLEYVTPVGVAECSTRDINERVRFDMNDYYIYYDQVPPLNATDFDSPEDYIRTLRVDPDVYSFVTDQEERELLVEEGMAQGYGFWFQVASDDVVRFREILAGSPSSDAGINRGDELISINSRPIAEYSSEEFSELFAEGQPPLAMQIRTGDQEPRSIEMSYTTYSWRTAQSFFFEAEGLPTVGLIEVRRFLETTEAELDAGIQFLLDQEIDELIIDLRYNPGGRTRVTERLAAQVVGPAFDGQPFLKRKWNDKYSDFDSTSTLEKAQPTFELPRVIVLQTENSASASEAFVNGLEPYIDVIVIGGVTTGKIFTSNSRDYCGKSINAMRSERINSVGVSVLGGIQPDCSVADDWTQSASHSDDALTSAGLFYIVNNACPTPSIASARSLNQVSEGLSFSGQDDMPLLPGDLVD